jgi:predicted MFS family arabinose efflux permease
MQPGRPGRDVRRAVPHRRGWARRGHALPALRDDLGLATIEAQWVLTAYALCFGGGLLLGGRLGDLYGRRRVLICGLALFAAGSLLAAVAPGLGVLIAGRAAQGAGSAAAIPATLAFGLRPVRGRTASVRRLHPMESRTHAPLVRLGILRVRSLRVATAAIGVNAIAFTAIVYVGTLYLQDELGYSPSRAGLALVPINVAGLAVSLLADRLLAGRSPRGALLASFAADVVALLWLARTPHPAHYLVDIMLPLTVLGVSLCLTFIIATQQAVADVGADEKRLASGIFESANHLFGGAVGVALYATLVAASGYAAAFLAAAGLAGIAAASALRAG